MTSSAIVSRLWPRYLAIGMGVVILLWLPFEDENEKATIIIALGICALSLIQFLISRSSRSFKNILLHILAGGLAGAAITPVAMLLIAIKAGLHDHNFSEYSIHQITTIIEATPYFIAGGLLITSSSAIARFARR